MSPNVRTLVVILVAAAILYAIVVAVVALEGQDGAGDGDAVRVATGIVTYPDRYRDAVLRRVYVMRSPEQSLATADLYVRFDSAGLPAEAMFSVRDPDGAILSAGHVVMSGQGWTYSASTNLCLPVDGGTGASEMVRFAPRFADPNGMLDAAWSPVEIVPPLPLSDWEPEPDPLAASSTAVSVQPLRYWISPENDGLRIVRGFSRSSGMEVFNALVLPGEITDEAFVSAQYVLLIERFEQTEEAAAMADADAYGDLCDPDDFDVWRETLE